jgi:phosphoribosyl 1,2-cyclic phosphodiesterase
MNNKGEMRIRFWGVRGSYPVPGHDTVRYGGNTACVEIEANGSTIILDAGTGIVPLGRALARRSREQERKISCVLLLSHLHHDHTQGFPFFLPAFIPGASINVYGPDFLGSSPRNTMEQVMQPPYFPVRVADLNANIAFQVLRETEVLLVEERGETAQTNTQVLPVGSMPVDDHRLRVRVLRSYAHPGGVYHYRIDWQGRSIVYATDTEGYVNGDRRLANFARGADLLIHDAQYTDEHYLGMAPGMSVTQGYGHSTVSIACHAAYAAGVKQLALFHHAPEYSDHQMDEVAAQAQAAFSPAIVAREGMEICLQARENEQAELTSMAVHVA